MGMGVVFGFVILMKLVDGVPFPLQTGVTCHLNWPDNLPMGPGPMVLPSIDWFWTPEDNHPWYYITWDTITQWRLNCEGFLKGNNPSGTSLLLQFLGDFNFTLSGIPFSGSSDSSSNFSSSLFMVPDDGVYPFSLEYFKTSLHGEFILHWIGENNTKSVVPSESFAHPTLPSSGFCGLIEDPTTFRTDTVFLPSPDVLFYSTNPFNSINYQNTGVYVSFFGVFVPPHPSGAELYEFQFGLDDEGYIVIGGSRYESTWEYEATFSMNLEALTPIQIFITNYDGAITGTIYLEWKNSTQSDYQTLAGFMSFPDISEGDIKCESYFSCDNPTADKLTISTNQELVGNKLVVNELIIQHQNTFNVINSTLNVNGNVNVIGTLSNTNSFVNINGTLHLGTPASILIYSDGRPMDISTVYLDGNLIINYVDGHENGTIMNSGDLVGQFKTVKVVGGPCSNAARITYTSTTVAFDLKGGCGNGGGDNTFQDNLKWIILGACLGVFLIALLIVAIWYHQRRARMNKAINKLRNPSKHPDQ